MTVQPAAVLNSEMRLMESKSTGRTYRITIALPLGYDKSPGEGWPFKNQPDKWPTVYVLDGNWYFGMVAGIIRPMAWCGGTTDAIVVGIGYPEGEDPSEAWRESFTRRNIDLTPAQDEAEEKSMEERFQRPVPSGDAGGFLKFIQEELIPLVESEFRVDPSRRILVGHSYGGLFGLFALFESPRLFDTLIIGSPTMVYASRWMFQREEDFAREQKRLPANVYLYAGELEESPESTDLSDMIRLGALLEGRGYAGLTLVRQIFPGLNHCEVAAPGFQAGLKFALKR